MKLKRESLADQIVIEFIDQIQKGVFTYGEKLPSHEKLSEYFEVSRIVLREALNKLQALGIVHVHQGKGTYIRAQEEMASFPAQIMQFKFSSHESLMHIFESRRFLETATVRLASERRNEKDCTELKKLYDLMVENINDIDTYSKYDLEFHTTIAKASKNPVLIQMLHLIKDIYQGEMNAVFKIPGIFKASTEAHYEIYQAIVNQDAEKAASIMEEHIRIVERILEKDPNVKVLEEDVIQ